MIDKIKNITNETLQKIEFSKDEIIDNVSSTIDGGIANVVIVKDTITGGFQTFFGVSVAIAAVTAPIPTIVGLMVLDLMLEVIKTNNENIINESKEKEKNRNINSILKSINKYGKIPKNSILETEFIYLSLNIENQSANGYLKKTDGNINLEQFSVLEMKEMILNLENKNDIKILNSYINLVELKNKG